MSVPVTIVATGNDGAGGAPPACGFGEQLYNDIASIAKIKLFMIIVLLLLYGCIVILCKCVDLFDYHPQHGP